MPACTLSPSYKRTTKQFFPSTILCFTPLKNLKVRLLHRIGILGEISRCFNFEADYNNILKFAINVHIICFVII